MLASSECAHRPRRRGPPTSGRPAASVPLTIMRLLLRRTPPVTASCRPLDTRAPALLQPPLYYFMIDRATLPRNAVGLTRGRSQQDANRFDADRKSRSSGEPPRLARHRGSSRHDAPQASRQCLRADEPPAGSPRDLSYDTRIRPSQRLSQRRSDADNRCKRAPFPCIRSGVVAAGRAMRRTRRPRGRSGACGARARGEPAAGRALPARSTFFGVSSPGRTSFLPGGRPPAGPPALLRRRIGHRGFRPGSGDPASACASGRFRAGRRLDAAATDAGPPTPPHALRTSITLLSRWPAPPPPPARWRVPYGCPPDNPTSAPARLERTLQMTWDNAVLAAPGRAARGREGKRRPGGRPRTLPLACRYT